MLLEIISLVILLILSGLFSSSETAFMSLPEHKIKNLVRKRVKFAKTLEKLTSNPRRLIITILIGNNIVNIAASALATVVAIDLFGSSGAGIATGVMVFLILIFGEITPKTYATINAQKLSLLFARPMLFLMYLFHPFVWLFERLTFLLLKLFGKSEKEELTQSEIVSLLRLGSSKRVIDKDERELMENVLELDQTKVSEIMTRKKKILMLDQETPIYESIETINRNPHSRIPIYMEKPFKLKGFVLIKDILLNANNPNKKLKELKKQIFFVRDNLKVDEVLDQMKRAGLHLAAVEDKNNKLLGIVTLEDIIEEIFGEIYDETDVNSERSVKINKNNFIVHSDTKIGKINWLFENQIPSRFNNLTVEEFLGNKCKECKNGTSITRYGLKFRINASVRGKPRLIRIIKKR
jgi:putative hemolysin